MLAWFSSRVTQEVGNPPLGPCPIFDFPAGAAPARRQLCLLPSVKEGLELLPGCSVLLPPSPMQGRSL